MKRRAQLILFVKPARRGAVKTRLAREIGGAEAWAFYRRTVRRLLHRLGRDPRFRCVLAVPGGRRAALDPFWRVARVAVIDQGRGDLGARMRRAFAGVPPGPALLIGGDIPGVRVSELRAALHALGRAELVFGPAQDGGFWLVGLRRAGRRFRLFEKIAWSSPHTLNDVLAKLPDHVPVTFGSTLDDVDGAPAYQRAQDAERRSRSMRRGMSSTRLQGRQR